MCNGTMNGKITMESSSSDGRTRHRKVHSQDQCRLVRQQAGGMTSTSSGIYKGADCGSVKPLPCAMSELRPLRTPRVIFVAEAGAFSVEDFPFETKIGGVSARTGSSFFRSYPAPSQVSSAQCRALKSTPSLPALKSNTPPGAGSFLSCTTAGPSFAADTASPICRTLRPIDEHTNFRLASFTKQFTAAAIMLLARDGKLRYDDHLHGILS